MPTQRLTGIRARILRGARSLGYMSAAAVLVVCVSTNGLAQSANAPSKANAAELVKTAKRAVGQIAKSAQSDPALDPDSTNAKPFWDAMRGLNESLNSAETGMILKDGTFFSSLASASALVEQAQIAYAMNDSGNAEVAKSLETLSGIVATLNENYSKEAARLKQGGELTAKERTQLDKLKAQQRQLQKKLAETERNVAKNNRKIKRGMERIRENSRRIERAGYGVGDFFAAMIAARIVSELLWGWHWWWGPWGGWAPGVIVVQIDVWDDWAELYDYDWDLVDTYADVSELELDGIDIADADVEETESWLEAGDFSLEEGDLAAMTGDLEAGGWDDVSTDIGQEVMQGTAENFEQVPYDPGFEAQTFDDHGMDDFGGGFDSDMDFGGGDW